MRDPLQGPVSVVGRVLLIGIFLMSAVGNKIPQFNTVASIMEAEGVPLPHGMLVGAILFLVAGSLSIALGWKAKWGATLLLVFLVLATYFFHDFWTHPPDALWVSSLDPNIKRPIQQLEMISFMKNVALMGAMLLIIANGVGPMSLDNWLEKRAAQQDLEEEDDE